MTQIVLRIAKSKLHIKVECTQKSCVDMEIVEQIASVEVKTVLSRPKKSATQVGKETNQIDKAEQTRNLRLPVGSTSGL